MQSRAPTPSSDKPATLADDVRHAQTGDLQAFQRLYRSNVGRITALCRYLTGDATRGDDLMQDTFVRAWERLQSFRGESSLESWLHRVAVNLFLMRDRSERRRGAHEEPINDAREGTTAAVNSDPGDRIDLERAIARLPEGARIAFVLHEIEGYSHEEIAAMIGIAAATVRVQLHRARRHLMEELRA